VRKENKNIRELINWATCYLEKKGVDSPRLNAELIAGKIKGRPRIYFYLEPDLSFSEEEMGLFKKEIRRRGRRVPLAYITGEQYFMEYRFLISPGVYIPRPETEILVEEACKILEEQRKFTPLIVVDIGTGSGNIAISIAKKIKTARIYAVDISPLALRIAQINAQLNKTHQGIDFLLGDLFSPLEKKNLMNKVDLIVSNPPYVDSRQMRSLPPEVKKEPVVALDGGKDGLSFYKRIIPESSLWLKKGGWLVLEIGYNQAKEVIQIITEEGGHLNSPRVIYDLDGNSRLIIARRKY